MTLWWRKGKQIIFLRASQTEILEVSTLLGTWFYIPLILVK